jgi:quercetin dioxygenase-like cupin family protein
MAAQDGEGRGIRVFRGADAPTLLEAGCLTLVPPDLAQAVGMGKMARAGYAEGDEIKVLVNVPGFSLTYVWFKPNYPLPLHSHDGDCLYYVIAGSLDLGTETLGSRDSFLIPANTPYSYKPGPDGVEVLEFRHETHFEFRNAVRNAAYFDKAAAGVAQNLEEWRRVPRPSELTPRLG